MSRSPRILAFAGSLRKESFNKKLIRLAASAARRAGAEVTLIDLADYRLPIFDEDLEKAEGMPEAGAKLKQLFKDNDGLLLSCPEYNSSITAVLKNTIDWVSRPAPEEPRLAAYQGKTAVLMSASPGALGGLRGLVHVRAILGNIGVTVLPNQVAVSQAHQAFHEDGTLVDEEKQKKIDGLGERLAEFLTKQLS